MATVNKGQQEQQTRHRASKKRPSLKWWLKNWPRFLFFFCAEILRIIAKSIIWILIIGAFIVLTSITGWQELADVLFRNLTLVGIIRDLLLVLLGVAMGRSFRRKRRNKVTRKEVEEKEQVPEKTQVKAEAQPVEPPKE